METQNYELSNTSLALEQSLDLLAVKKRKHPWLPTESKVLPVVGILAFFILWEAVYAFKLVNQVWISGPWPTVVETYHLFGQPFFHTDLSTSGEEMLIGLGISIIVGVIGGLLYGWYRRVRLTLGSLLHGYNAMPHIALVPLFILIFGIGIWSKVALIVAICTTTFWLNTAAGVENIDEKYIRLAKSFGTTDLILFRTIAFPAVFPYLVSAFRLGVGRALIAIVVAELYGSTSGVGHLLNVAAQNFETSEEFATLLVITAFGILCNVFLGRIERRFNAWRG